jgi:hypothetical protein
VLPLVSYALLATGLVAVLWNRLQAVPKHPLEQYLPDNEGDRPGVEKKLKLMSPDRKRLLTQIALDPSSCVRLGETLQVGDLAVTPRKVEWQQVYVAQPGREERPEPVRRRDGDMAPAPSLVLHLHLENTSPDYAFQPLDRYFDRHWKDGEGAPPLTVLEAGAARFYGGPAVWMARRGRSADAVPEYLYLRCGDGFERNAVDALLSPGGSCDAFVCTDAADPSAGELRRYRGELLWRVHLRRGLVAVRGAEVPAAAVVGVRFRAGQVAGGG